MLINRTAEVYANLYICEKYPRVHRLNKRDSESEKHVSKLAKERKKKEKGKTHKLPQISKISINLSQCVSLKLLFEFLSPSLNRKYSHHGRSANDVAGRGFDLEDLSRSNRQHGDGVASKCKMSKYCHRCGFKFPETAKFCCECGIRRLVL